MREKGFCRGWPRTRKRMFKEERASREGWYHTVSQEASSREALWFSINIQIRESIPSQSFFPLHLLSHVLLCFFGYCRSNKVHTMCSKSRNQAVQEDHAKE